MSADHGHLLDVTQDDDMKIDTPGGEKVDLHRRCWAGRGGKTPAGAVRVSGANLGYDTDLDFVFPNGRGVFLSGGGLQYHHGGSQPSGDDRSGPLASRWRRAADGAGARRRRSSSTTSPSRSPTAPSACALSWRRDLFAEPHWVRVVLLHAVGAGRRGGDGPGRHLDPRTKRIQLTPGQPATVGLMLSRDDCKSVRMVVLDAETEAVLAQSKNLNVKLSI